MRDLCLGNVNPCSLWIGSRRTADLVPKGSVGVSVAA